MGIYLRQAFGKQLVIIGTTSRKDWPLSFGLRQANYRCVRPRAVVTVKTRRRILEELPEPRTPFAVLRLPWSRVEANMRHAHIPVLAVGILMSVGLCSRSVAADPVVITGGVLSVFSQIDLPGFTICTGLNCQSPGSGNSVFNGVLASNAQQFFNAGDTVTPVGGGIINADGPVPEIINGMALQAFLSGSFTVTATPFVAPSQSGAATFSFTTPFAMQGHIAGSADPEHQMPLFSVDVVGSGIETVSGRTFSGGNPTDYEATSFVAGFQPPAPTPEPASGVLLGGALLGGWLYRRKARVRIGV